MSDETKPENTDDRAEKRVLTPEAQRALEEAAARRAAEEKRRDEARPREIDGREGPDPVRYADWEVKGLAVDF